jgi:predicted anti-sigma-YlaC factor YlaD
MPHTACEFQRDRIQEALDGALAPQEQTKLARHLLGCAECRAYEDAIARTFGRLTSVLSTTAETPDLVLAVENALRPPIASRVRRPLGPKGLAWGVAVAGTLFAVGLAAPRSHTASLPPVAVASAGHLDTATAAIAIAAPVTAADVENGRAILSWFGPDPDAGFEE